MPTHRELPDSYLRVRPPRKRPSAAWIVLALVCAVAIGAGYYGASDLLPAAQAPSDAVAPAPVKSAHRARRQHATRRRRRHIIAKRHAPIGVAATEPLVPAGVPHHAGTALLAVGVSLPGTGLAPRLRVTTESSEVIVQTRSSMPVLITSDSRYGQPLHTWTKLARGARVSRIVPTGVRYGYCFSQARGDGYAATRACGTLTMHETLMGARLPDGPPATSVFYFLAS